MTVAPSPSLEEVDLGRAEPFGPSFIGVAVLLGAIALAEPLIFGAGYYQTLSIHPFWVAILLAACQHGLAVGLASVALATILLGAPERPVGVDATMHFAQSVVLPVQWLALTLILGTYRQRQLSAAEALWQRNERLAQMNETLARELDRMDAMVTTVERSAAAQVLVASPALLALSVPPTLRAVPAMPTEAAAAPRGDQDMHRLLAELAAASIADLPAAFTRAAAAVLDAPVVLILRFPDESPLVICPPHGIDLEPAQALRILDRSDGPSQSVAIVRGDLGLSGEGVVLLRAQTRAVGHDLHFALAAFPEAANSPTLQGQSQRLDVLAGMVRLWVDRFGAELAADADDDAAMVGNA